MASGADEALKHTGPVLSGSKDAGQSSMGGMFESLKFVSYKMMSGCFL